MQTTALLDTGCETTLIDRELAMVLGLKGMPYQAKLKTFHGQDPHLKIESASCLITSVNNQNGFKISKALIVPRLKVSHRRIDWPIKKKRWGHLTNLNLPVLDTADVGVFIGANVPEALRQLELRIADQTSPVGVSTPFGWTVMGQVPVELLRERKFANTPPCYGVRVEDSEEDVVLQQFWFHESFGTRKEKSTYISQLEESALATLRNSIKNIGERYEVGLPWKSDNVRLPNNRSTALRRLYATESRFRVDPLFAKRYTKAIETNMELGFARRLNLSELEGPQGRTWYVPHFLVENANKPDKPRLVFDAASKHEGISLNDALINGPTLLSNMHNLLVQFRERPYAVSMDIEKMFLQVRVREEDQAAFRFVWRRPGSQEPPITYQMMVEIFGAASSPTSCTFVLRQIPIDNPGYEDIASKVTENFYVDNYLDSFDDEDSAISCCKRLTELLKKGGFKLTHLMTSSKRVWMSFPSTVRADPTLNIDLDNLPSERTLGLLWHGETDTFAFKFKELENATTKRQVYSAITRIFDPMGFIACVTLIPKIVLQEVWRIGRDTKEPRVKWDDELPEGALKQWNSFVRKIKSLTGLHIPRSFRPPSFPATLTEFQLHIFCDASSRGYSAIVYLRCQYLTEVYIAFVTARARVAPLDQQSIPRLELLAAVLGCRLGTTVKEGLKSPLSSVTWWTDSSTVLHWLRTKATAYNTWVASRREAILEDSTSSQWRHVPGNLNPADDGSRGVQANDLNIQHRWFQGPEFLKKSEDFWPPLLHSDPNEEDLEKIPPIFIGNATVEDDKDIDRHIAESTSLTNLKRTVATEKAIDGSILGPKELHSALNSCIRSVQRKNYNDEISALKGRRLLPRVSPLRKLDPFLDKDHLLRVGGRVERCSELTFDARHQVIIPFQDPLTDLIIRDAHETNFHSQISRTLYDVRTRYWILKGRRAVERIVRKCELCLKRYAKPLTPQMAPLPAARLQAFVPAFTNVGVDYFGPLYVSIGRRAEKRYGCLFTCLTTRAIHIELAHSMDTDSFLMAFRRFVSLRRSPLQVYSDNGTNLTAGEKELREGLDRMKMDHRLRDQLADRGINWQFSPPGAPHFGGVWERMVRSAKSALRVVLGHQTVPEEVLATVLREVESMLNARPLTHLSMDPKDPSPLTPYHFLLGYPHPHLPPDVTEDRRGLTRRRWLRAQVLAEQFWKRWLIEYVPSLTERPKWTDPQRNVEVGDKVLVVDNQTPRGNWPVGEIVKVLPGKPDPRSRKKEPTIRTVVVRTDSGEYRKAVAKLCLLRTAEKEIGP